MAAYPGTGSIVRIGPVVEHKDPALAAVAEKELANFLVEGDDIGLAARGLHGGQDRELCRRGGQGGFDRAPFEALVALGVHCEAFLRRNLRRPRRGLRVRRPPPRYLENPLS